MSNPQEFLGLQLAHAHAVYRERGSINPVVAAGMAALESAWGTSRLYVEARNPLGVKAGSSWQGDTITLPTREEVGGELVPTTAKWRKYPTLQQAYEDFAQIIERLSWYADARDAAAIPQDFLAGLIAKRDEVGDVVEPGWATDSSYYDKVWSIITQHRVRDMYDALRRGLPPTLPGGEVPAGGPERIGGEYSVFVLNPPFEEGDKAAFGAAVDRSAPYVVRAPHVASRTTTGSGVKLDVRRDAPGRAETGLPREKAAVESTGVLGGVVSLLAILVLAIGPYVGLEIDADLRNLLLVIAGGGGSALAVSGRVKADSKITGVLTAGKVER